MPNWTEILYELQSTSLSHGSAYDKIRRKYIRQLQLYSKRNIICYYSGWLQKPENQFFNSVSVNDIDKNGLMSVINGLNENVGLDLILHTPGGDIAATESIVDYLYKKFSGDIRCFIPQMAMSAGTMIACSCREIWMGKQSSLGPVDPQINGMAAHGIVEEYEKAKAEFLSNPQTYPILQSILSQYPLPFIGECKKLISWSEQLITEWLDRNMLANINNKNQIIDKIKNELTDHAISLAHGRHLSADKCKSIGLNVIDLESDQKLQDCVLSVHHSYIHTLSNTPALKIIENHKNIAFIHQANQMQFAIPSMFPNQMGIALHNQHDIPIAPLNAKIDFEDIKKD